MGIAYNTSIVRDGLVLHLDAANVKSYPGSGTTVVDLSSNTQNSSMNNGASVSNGAFTFDGIDDNISVPSRTFTEWTFCYWFYHDTTSGSDMTIGQNGFNANRFYHRDTGTADYRLRVHNADAVSMGDMVIGDGYWQKWTHLAYGIDASGSIHGWVNGERALTKSLDASTTFIFDNIGNVHTSGFIWQGSLNNIMAYNRKLTDEEVRQNFEAHRGRYGL